MTDTTKRSMLKLASWSPLRRRRAGGLRQEGRAGAAGSPPASAPASAPAPSPSR
jgi:hypothetical protein